MLREKQMAVRMDKEVVRGNTRPSKILEGLETIGVGFEADGNPLLDAACNLSCSCLEDLKKEFFTGYLKLHLEDTNFVKRLERNYLCLGLK